MRELDVLLTRYLDGCYESATESQKAAFGALLALPDPELIGYLLYRDIPEQEDIADIVQQIRSQAGA